MFDSALKRLGWCCSFAILLIAGWFTLNILLPSLTLPQHSRPLLKFKSGRWGTDQIAFSPDGKEILCLYYKEKTGGNAIRRWNIQTGEKLKPVTSSERLVFLSKDGRFYATEDKSNRHTTRFYQLSNQKLIGTLPFGNLGESLTDIVSQPPLAVSIKYKTVPGKRKSDHVETRQYLIRKIHTGELLTPHSIPRESIPEAIWDPGIALAKDGSKVLSLYPVYIEDEKEKSQQLSNQLNGFPTKAITPIVKIKTLDWLTGKKQTLPFPQELYKPSPMLGNSSYQTPQLSDNGDLYAAVSFTIKNSASADGQDGSIWCYDLSQKKLRWYYHHEKSFPLMMKFSPDGTMLAAGGFDTDYRGNMGCVYVIDVKTGKLLHIFSEQTWKDQLKDRTILALNRIKIKLYDTINFYRRTDLYLDYSYYNKFAPNDSGIPLALSWSPDSKMLAVSYANAEVKLWNVK